MIGTLLNGRFRLDERLGSGGMSTVYRAFDETLERWVAIKLLHREISGEADQLERFRREARAVARLSSPNVVGVIDAGEDDGHPYIVFECIDGETLKERIRRLGRLPVDEAIAYAIEIGRALAAAHASKLVHRDVKPQNVLLDEEGRAKVTDFGIARSLEAQGLTMTGRVLGTTDYVSPEQALGHSVSGQSDIYSLGVVLFEMLTGDVPHKADTQVGVAMKHVREPLPNVQVRRPEVSSTLAAVVEHATAKETGNRYRTIDDMVHDLEQALAIEAARSGHTTGGEATSVLRHLPPDSSSYAPTRLRRPARWLATAMLIGAAAAAALVVLASRTEQGTTGDADRGLPGLAPATLLAANDYDPAGDGEEHADETAQAIDDNRTTFWSTEGYRGGLTKAGVGLYVDTGGPVAARRLSIVSPEPGFEAAVYAADDVPSQIGGWTRVAAPTTVGETARIRLDTRGRGFRNYLIWITRLPAGQSRASISEITLLR
ncbi:MAG: protein kinase [Thermoleophilaceae bacterium]